MYAVDGIIEMGNVSNSINSSRERGNGYLFFHLERLKEDIVSYELPQRYARWATETLL